MKENKGNMFTACLLAMRILSEKSPKQIENNFTLNSRERRYLMESWRKYWREANYCLLSLLLMALLMHTLLLQVHPTYLGTGIRLQNLRVPYCSYFPVKHVFFNLKNRIFAKLWAFPV